MAAIEGFDLSLSSGDLLVEDGMLDGTAIEGATLDASALANGVAYAVVVAAGTLALKEAADVLATDTILGSATVATGAATLPSLAGRGTQAEPVYA